MPDNIDPKTAGRSIPDVPSRNEMLFGMETGPILAIITIVLTFAMFVYFVHLAGTPSKESVELRFATKSLAEAELKFSQASSSKTERLVPGKLDELRKERDKLKNQASCAKEAADDAKDRRGMVKDFVLYILGVLSSALTTIFGYYFGSSKGSSDKSLALNTIASKNQPPPQPPVQPPVKPPEQ